MPKRTPHTQPNTKALIPQCSFIFSRALGAAKISLTTFERYYGHNNIASLIININPKVKALQTGVTV
jgi:hypothetical protein